jgi:hypothetical protein
MAKIRLSYQELGENAAPYIEVLLSKEDIIRDGLEGMGISGDAHWLCDTVENGNVLFRLVADADQQECLTQFTPLDLQLEHDEIVQLMVTGQRPCKC